MWTGIVILLISCLVLWESKDNNWLIGQGLAGIGILTGLGFIAWALLTGILHWLGWFLIPFGLVFLVYQLMRKQT